MKRSLSQILSVTDLRWGEMKKEHLAPLVSIKFCNDFSVENFPSDPKIFIGFLIEL